MDSMHRRRFLAGAVPALASMALPDVAFGQEPNSILMLHPAADVLVTIDGTSMGEALADHFTPFHILGGDHVVNLVAKDNSGYWSGRLRTNVGEQSLFEPTLLPTDLSIGRPGTWQDPADGLIYRTVEINRNVWLAQHYRRNAGRNSYPQKRSDLVEGWGRLYEWPDPPALVPAGWHIPSNDEYRALVSLYPEGGSALLPGGKSGFDIKLSGSNYGPPNTLPQSFGAYCYLWTNRAYTFTIGPHGQNDIDRTDEKRDQGSYSLRFVRRAT